MKKTTQMIVWIAMMTSAASTVFAAPGGNGVVPRLGWLDSYSANGRCYIDSTFDHGIGGKIVSTPIGGQSVRQVAAKIGPGPGRAGNPVYNDVQCGNGPANNAGDEDYDQCPGRVDQGAAGCSVIGPRWDLALAYGNSPTPSTATPEPVTVSAAPSNVVQTVQITENANQCSAIGPTLATAKAAFTAECPTFQRQDCDPITLDNQNVWMCASYRVEANSVETTNLETTSVETTSVETTGVETTGVETTGVESTGVESTGVESTGVETTGQCEALGPNLSAARRAYSQQCTLPRIDCDPTGNGAEYLCASYNIPSTAVNVSPLVSPVATVPAPAAPTVVSQSPSTAATCDATGATLQLAIAAYAASCTLPRRDCDPVSGGYLCASYTIGNAAPSWSAPSNSATETNDPANNPVTAPVTTAPTNTTVQPSAGNVRIEAENQTGGGWISRGDHIEFTGENSYASATYGALTYNVSIPSSGVWEMRWRAKAARQTPGRTDLHNDAWAKMNGEPVAGVHDVRTFRKVFSSGNGNWQVNATAEIGSHNFSRFRQRFTAGTYQFQLSGRSSGYAIDYIEFVQISGQAAPTASNTVTSTTGSATSIDASGTGLPPLLGVAGYLDTFNQPYVEGDLLSLHWDSSNDPDDMQAMILTREMLDSHAGGSVDFMAVNGTKRTDNPSILSGSTAHMRTLYPSSLEAWRNGLSGAEQSRLYANTVGAFATAWSLTLSTGNRVHVADGGPSNFTASVIEELLRRGVATAALKRIRVVQHSWGFNEVHTNTRALNIVRRYASYIRIANGNQGNGEGPGHTATPDFEFKRSTEAGCGQFRTRALNSGYSSQWRTAFNKISNKCDGSDAVEVVWILGIPTNEIPTLDRFANRYF